MVSEDGSLGRSVAEEQEWPPGFRFHPTDEELVLYYLKRKICRKKLKLDIIAETDVYKSDPEELPGLSLLKTGDRQWFFFSPRDRKYPNGARSNRATKQGYWKATGKDRIITCGSRSVGLKKTLVFYRGRAPNGERTDWVMHEYTLDEEEFKRCQNVQGYYALYKVFKKSGAGPKNGEQYGAPFREEDWNDDCPDFNNPASLDISVEKVDEDSPHAVTNVHNCQVPPFSDDIDEFIKNLTEDCLADLPPINVCAYTPSQVLSHEDVRKTMMDVPCRDIAIQEPVCMLSANGVQRNLQQSFNLSHVTVSEIEAYEVSNIAYTDAKFPEQEVYVLPEEDFLEMDDLLGPEPIKNNVEEAPNDFLVDERDGLSEFDLYHDAAMFLNDMGASPSEVANHYEYHAGPNQHGLGQDVHPPCIHLPGGIVNQPYLEVVDPINYQLYLNSADQINNQFYSDDASQSQSQGSVLTSAEIYNDIGNYLDPDSGVAYETSDISFQVNQNQGGNEVNGATSWLSSAVWSFVESIPTTPASAAENALVNRAFERMSSFSRLRMNAMTASTPAVSDSEPAKKSRNRGFIFFPILVAVLAIFWVVLGAVSVWTPGISA